MEPCLEGTRVIQVGTGVGAGFCGHLLAGLGADVVKLETEVPGDSVDQRAARLYLDSRKRVERSDAGSDADAVEASVDDAAVVVFGLEHSRGAQDAGRLRDVYDRLRARRPDLVFAALTPFGVAGPLARLAGGDLQAQALSGWTSIVGNPDEAPLAMNYGVAAMQQGLSAAGAVVAALLRDHPEGEFIDIAHAEVVAALIHMYEGTYRFAGIPLVRAGHRAPGSSGRYPHTMLPCKDGKIIMICRSIPEWDRVLTMIGDPSWGQEPRYRDFHAMATEYPDEVDALITPWLMEHTKDEITILARRHRVPMAPIRTAAEVLTDPQLAFRGFFDRLQSDAGEVLVPGFPAIWTRPSTTAGPPGMEKRAAS